MKRRGVIKIANGSLMRKEYCCVEVERETGQMRQRGNGRGLGIGEASCDAE